MRSPRRAFFTRRRPRRARRPSRPATAGGPLVGRLGLRHPCRGGVAEPRMRHPRLPDVPALRRRLLAQTGACHCRFRGDAHALPGGRLRPRAAPMARFALLISPARANDRSLADIVSRRRGEGDSMRPTTNELLRLQKMHNGEKGQGHVQRRGNAAPAGRAAPLARRNEARRRAADLLPQHQLFRRFPVLLVRPQIRLRRHACSRGLDFRRHRRRPAVAAHLRRQHHLYRLAQGQLFLRAAARAERRQARRHRVRPHQPRSCTSSSRDALPGVEFVDIGQATMWMRTIKSARRNRAHPRRRARRPTSAATPSATRSARARRARGRARRHAGDGAPYRRNLPACRADGHLGLVPVGDQHRRRAQPGDLAQACKRATSSRSTASR